MDAIADYELLDSLGTGNHGEFWLARPPARLGLPDGVMVAVKVLAIQATENDFDRIANELRIHASVSSPHLAPVLDAGQQDGRLFYTTAYYPDGSLDSPARPLDRAAVLAAVAGAARACHALHEAGIAHRDVKPGNILLDEGRGLLGDLGLAQLLSPGQTVTGIGPVGTVQFLAPETVRGEPASRASDVWSFGATLHGVVSGRSIFPGLEQLDLLGALRTILSEPPTIDDAIDPSVRTVVARAVAVDPGDRHPTAADFADDVERIAAS